MAASRAASASGSLWRREQVVPGAAEEVPRRGRRRRLLLPAVVGRLPRARPRRTVGPRRLGRRRFPVHRRLPASRGQPGRTRGADFAVVGSQGGCQVVAVVALLLLELVGELVLQGLEKLQQS